MRIYKDISKEQNEKPHYIASVSLILFKRISQYHFLSWPFTFFTYSKMWSSFCLLNSQFSQEVVESMNERKTLGYLMKVYLVVLFIECLLYVKEVGNEVTVFWVFMSVLLFIISCKGPIYELRRNSHHIGYQIDDFLMTLILWHIMIYLMTFIFLLILFKDLSDYTDRYISCF